MADLWQTIKQARTEAGLTQQDLAEKCGVTTAAVSRWESPDEGTRTIPRLYHITEISSATGVPTIEFLKHLEDPPSLNDSLNDSTLEDVLNTSLWNKIRSARVQAKLTQADLAEACGVSRGAVANWESSKKLDKKPKLSTLRRIAEVTGVNYLWLTSEKQGISQEWIEQNPDYDNDDIDEKLAYEAEARKEDAIKITMDTCSYIIDNGISREFYEQLKALNAALKRYHKK
ncbi:helix-turn-helix transcriptional regulator [Zooshikella harenae]|uniref:Helix-turn-helix transcriptional regulator n=1 Tax=Zooshikella harenae TaxID=2827238 RepID=A0ABS5ZIS6_9GAMM|nr:helix-turn-helix transcriptional regulator [Zooshikella harenae]MBU2713161.1 helix-turn-helix transcriptional regulator [Zooshikella harenae]